ncbi:acetate/propionate family kinase [Roseibium litorale]|uniref:Acetate kinase n=1 Tax=Roseibium litorale TaxID=2803841 RepID=A0ABR9CPW7_9HYPH|nr:acetate/propionate family kinase [Roseibium litorale]MBD8892332.1 acetate/propionate family kinase [Roseibium litorale]
MSPNITTLVLNCGSSSIKFTLYEGANGRLHGQVSGLGTSPRIELKDARSGKKLDDALSAADGQDHRHALQAVLAAISATCGDLKVDAVGHRVVHGGHPFVAPVAVDDSVILDLEALIPLAPLHQPHNVAGILAARQAFPDAFQAACFDTAFHRDHPWVNDTFALPRELYEEGVRRYGFHGLSYEYIASHLADQHPDLFRGRVVVAHLGNGASMCALQAGRSIDSTMGFTALDGLPMGTRTGQLDPGVVLYLLTTKGMTGAEISDLLYKKSGLLGLSGISSDMRTLSESPSAEARKAIDYFVFRIRREIGAMASVLGGLDAVVFTGGIGEHSALVRSEVCANQDWLGMEIDTALNASAEAVISKHTSRVKILVVPTNEEEMIRRHTLSLLQA